MTIRLAILFAVLLVTAWIVAKRFDDQVAVVFSRDDCDFDLASTKGSGMGIVACSRSQPASQVGFVWNDQADASTYHVTGNIGYWFTSCDADPPFGPTDGAEVDEMIPAGVTRFTFPLSTDPKTTTVKEYFIHIDALDSAGNVVASDGRGMINEPVCWDRVR